MLIKTNTSIFLLATWRAMQDKVLSVIILHVYWKKFLFHCKTKIKYPLFIPKYAPLIAEISNFSTQFPGWWLYNLCIIVWGLVSNYDYDFWYGIIPSLFIWRHSGPLAGFVLTWNKSKQPVLNILLYSREQHCAAWTALITQGSAHSVSQPSVQWILHSNWTSIFDIWYDV